MSMAEERPSRVTRKERSRVAVVGGEQRRATSRMPVPAKQVRGAADRPAGPTGATADAAVAAPRAADSTAALAASGSARAAATASRRAADRAADVAGAWVAAAVAAGRVSMRTARSPPPGSARAAPAPPTAVAAATGRPTVASTACPAIFPQAAVRAVQAAAALLHGPLMPYSRAKTPEASNRTENVPPVTPRSVPKSSRQTRGLVRPATVLAT